MDSYSRFNIGLLFELPQEILDLILSHLATPDLTVCLRVSHPWFDEPVGLPC